MNIRSRLGLYNDDCLYNQLIGGGQGFVSLGFIDSEEIKIVALEYITLWISQDQ